MLRSFYGIIKSILLDNQLHKDSPENSSISTSTIKKESPKNSSISTSAINKESPNLSSLSRSYINIGHQFYNHPSVKMRSHDWRVLHRIPKNGSQVSPPATSGFSQIHELLQESTRVSNPSRVVLKYQLSHQSPSQLLHHHLVVNLLPKLMTPLLLGYLLWDLSPISEICIGLDDLILMLKQFIMDSTSKKPIEEFFDAVEVISENNEDVCNRDLAKKAIWVSGILLAVAITTTIKVVHTS